MIRSLGIALAAVMALAAVPALAQEKEKGPDTKIDAASHAAGQKEAPAVVQASGIPCTVADAYLIGEAPGKDDQGKAIKTKYYEVACKEGDGFVLAAVAGATTPPKRFDCLTTRGNPSLQCRLPANADFKAAAGRLAKAAGRTCAVTDVRSLGATATGDSYYEIGCGDQLGFVAKSHADGKVEAFDCAQTLGTNIECKLTTPEQIKAAQTKTITALVAASGKTCGIKDTRTIGALSSGNIGYEVACTDGAGYVLLAKADGALANAIPCANAESIAGGCKLTDVTVAQTQEAATYTTLAKKAGFDCNVEKYHYIGIDKNKAEVVELQCSNRADGGIGVLPSDNSPGHVYDCVQAGVLGATCRLNKLETVFPKYSAILASKGRGACKVSNAAALGRYTTGDMIETACSDGLPGWVIALSPTTGQATELFTCGQARGAGIQCKLPGNTK